MNLIDILDLYSQLNGSDDLFLMLNDYVLDSRIDRSMLNRIILKELGAYRPFVNTPKVFKFALEEWFEKWNYNIGKLLDTLYYDYNPIWNKDLYGKEGEKKIADQDTTDKQVGRRTDNLTETMDDDTSGTMDSNGSVHQTEQLDTSAYDVSTYQPRTLTTTDRSESSHVSESGTDDYTKKNVGTVDNVLDDTGTLDRTDTRDLDTHEYGHDANNTYQELVQQERDLAEFNIFEWIIQQMKKELFLLVY